MPPSRLKRKFSRRLWTISTSLLVLVGLVVGMVLVQPQLSRAQLSKLDAAATVSTIPASQERAANTSAITHWLALGDRNSRVSALKAQLQQLGYETGDRTSYFNPATEEAVFQFQREAGIGRDGIVGEETQAALAQALESSEGTKKPTTAAVSTLPAPEGPPVSSISQTQNQIQSQIQSQTQGQIQSRTQSPPDIERILSQGKLVVAVLNKNNPPFFMTDEEDKLTGSDIVLAEELAEQLGVELEFNRSARTFNDVVEQVYNLEADLAISKISRTLKRAKSVSFSQPYLTMRQGLLVNRVQFAEQAKGENVAEMLRTLEGKVGVIRGSSYVGFVKQKFPKATIAEFSTWPEVVKAVTQGKVLAAYRDELEVKKIVRNNPDAALQFQTIALTDTQDPLAIVLPWDSHSLQDFVNQYLEVAHPDDTVDSLLDRYSGQI
ncbi:MAG: transporter substrate-binding domain-containing protein [Phormidesmis sp.]